MLTRPRLTDEQRAGLWANLANARRVLREVRKRRDELVAAAVDDELDGRLRRAGRGQAWERL